jgi:transcription elongation factor/antiterminator RfaH
MQNKNAKPSKELVQALTAAQVANRMGLTTRQLQDLRLRGIGPPIVQRGLSIHYELADVREIERHEAMAILEQVLASDRPLTLLRAMAEHGSFKLSPILQQVSVPIPSPVTEPIRVPETPVSSELPEPVSSVITPVAAPEPLPANPPALTLISSAEPATLSTESWYLVHTKPRQEDVAVANLQRQGYDCYLPQMRVERIRRRKAEIASEPMFPRYLFIRLDSSDQGKSWSPIRSTLGVSQLVHFGARAAKVDDALVELLRQREQAMPLDPMFHSGDSVVIADGPFAGIEAIYQTADAEHRAFILLEILSKPVSMQIDTGRLYKAG